MSNFLSIDSVPLLSIINLVSTIFSCIKSVPSLVACFWPAPPLPACQLSTRFPKETSQPRSACRCLPLCPQPKTNGLYGQLFSAGYPLPACFSHPIFTLGWDSGSVSPVFFCASTQTCTNLLQETVYSLLRGVMDLICLTFKSTMSPQVLYAPAPQSHGCW